MAHPGDGRVLIEVDGKNDEAGKYRVLSEGLDDDHDEAFNEDGPGGVSPNRNFPFRYPFFARGRSAPGVGGREPGDRRFRV